MATAVGPGLWRIASKKTPGVVSRVFAVLGGVHGNEQVSSADCVAANPPAVRANLRGFRFFRRESQ